MDIQSFKAETIRNSKGLGDIAFSLLRLDPNNSPTHVYEIHIEYGMVKTTKRDLSDFKPDRWKPQFDVGPGKSCSIEFDGNWILDSQKRYKLITESTPWIFWTDNNDVLWVQKWDDTSSKVQLSTDVIKVASVRGWKNVTQVGVDQGLICAYIKNDNNLYYRNFAQQADLSSIWETERQVASFSNVQNIGLFRTNDYRTGFMVEANGVISWALTKRAWSGMAMEPEFISVGLNNYTIAVYPIEYSNPIENENISTGITNFYIGCSIPITPAIIDVITTLGDPTHLTAKFNYPIYESLSGIQAAFSLKDTSGVTFAITASAAGADQTELVFTTANISSAHNPMTLTYNNGVIKDNLVPLLTTVYNNVHFAVESGDTIFNANIAPPTGCEFENISVGLMRYAITVTQVYYKNRYETENLSVGLARFTILVTKVGSNPL